MPSANLFWRHEWVGRTTTAPVGGTGRGLLVSGPRILLCWGGRVLLVCSSTSSYICWMWGYMLESG